MRLKLSGLMGAPSEGALSSTSKLLPQQQYQDPAAAKAAPGSWLSSSSAISMSGAAAGRAADREVVLQRSTATGKAVLCDVTAAAARSAGEVGALAASGRGLGGYRYTTLQDTMHYIRSFTQA